MKKVLYYLLFEMIFIINIKAQHSVIQSIDFDSEGRTVFALTGFYDYSYILRYNNGNLESWNITELFNLPFLWVSSTIDKDGNIWAFQTAWLYKFDGTDWSIFDIPYSYSTYQKISHIETDNQNNIWISPFYEDFIFKLSHTDTTWKKYSIPHSTNKYCLAGDIAFEGDSIWVCSSTGLSLIFDDSISIALDTSNSNIPTEKLFSFHIDTKGDRWLGSYDKGLIKWVNDSTFVSYNTSNSNLPNNFVNAIAEDSKGTLWLATDNGFASFNGDSITSYSYLYNSSMPTLAIDQYDRVWLGTVFTGILFIFDGDSLTGITDVEEVQAQPQSFYLSQNYPNPFNPTTTINYQISEKGYVSIKVFDLLGREVATLVNEEKPAGSYEVEFQSSVGNSQLASGVYFYRIQAGDFIRTKKMLLLK